MKTKLYIFTLLIASLILVAPSSVLAGIYLVSGNGQEVGRSNCVVVMDDGTIYEGTSGNWDFTGVSVETAARMCLGFVPSGIITSVGSTIEQQEVGIKNIGDVPNLSGNITYPFYTTPTIAIKSNILIAESTLQSLGLIKSKPDYIYDKISSDAIKAFQQKMSLPQTGTIDKITWLLLLTR